MRTSVLLTAAAASALALSACNNKSQVGNTAGTGNTEWAGNSMNPGQSGPVNAAQDATGAAVGSVSASTLGGHDTGAFVDNAARSNMYEIQAADIAREKSKNPDVKAFAKMMVDDHTSLETQMKPAIQSAGQTAPTDLDQRRKGLLDNLKAAAPADFDKTYIDQQVAAHQEALTLMKAYADNGDNAGLKAAATKATPIIQKHLDRAQALQVKLGG
jgi:putative membrane protein